MHPVPSSDFDPNWYLRTYQDVDRAGMDPHFHYINHGKAEGRLPRLMAAESFKTALWQNCCPIAYARLTTLAATACFSERSYAKWILAQWYAFREDWTGVVALFDDIDLADPDFVPGNSGPLFLAAFAACRVGRHEVSLKLQRELEDRGLKDQVWPLSWQRTLELLNRNERADTDSAKSLINTVLDRVYRNRGLTPISAQAFQIADKRNKLLSSCSSMVSIIVPVYNVSAYIVSALESIANQTWPSIEVIIVDDASTDTSFSKIENFIARTKFRSGLAIAAIGLKENSGPYVARNIGLRNCRGDFITTHDGDDWSHPEKIERQVRALMRNPSAVASMSSWIRMDESLDISPWFPEVWPCHRNLSSLLFRRKVIDTLGYWDEVRFAGDSEFLERIETRFGVASVIDVETNIPLSIGLRRPGSLTQAYSGKGSAESNALRSQYRDAFRRWHITSDQLFIRPSSPTRPFLAPTPMLAGVQLATADSFVDRLRQSGLWDESWYLERYPDLITYCGDLIDHFAQHGMREQRDPGPNFSSSAYVEKYFPHRTSESSPIGAVEHYIFHGNQERYRALPVFEGRVRRRLGAQVVLLCGHQSLAEVFGAERCLLDIAAALYEIGYDVCVTLPAVSSRVYLEDLLNFAFAVHAVPTMWWSEHRAASVDEVRNYAYLIRKYNAVVVHANTIVLDAPLIAARACDVTLVVHMHEDPVSNLDICESMETSAEAALRRIDTMADVVICNSDFVRRSYLRNIKASRIQPVCVPNALIEKSVLGQIQRRRDDAFFNVGLISNNTLAKGLSDIEVIASLLSHEESAGAPRSVRFLLFGPLTNDVEKLLKRCSCDSSVAKVLYCGYVHKVDSALARLDAVLSLSRIPESFGRSVIEAMAAGVPTISYAHGAIPDIVQDGVDGFLVPFGDVQEVKRIIQALMNNPSVYAEISHNSKVKAEQFSFGFFCDHLKKLYSQFPH